MDLPKVGNLPVFVTPQLSRPQAESLIELIDLAIEGEDNEIPRLDFVRIRRVLEGAMR